MADQLLEEFEPTISGIQLIPSRGGVFEVVVDGELVYSKKQTGEHAEYEQVAGPIRSMVG